MTDFNVYDLLISEYKHRIIIEEEDKDKYRYVYLTYRNKTECAKNYFELGIAARFNIDVINNRVFSSDEYWYLKECIPLMEQRLCEKLTEDEYKEKLGSKNELQPPRQ